MSKEKYLLKEKEFEVNTEDYFNPKHFQDLKVYKRVAFRYLPTEQNPLYISNGPFIRVGRNKRQRGICVLFYLQHNQIVKNVSLITKASDDENFEKYVISIGVTKGIDNRRSDSTSKELRQLWEMIIRPHSDHREKITSKTQFEVNLDFNEWSNGHNSLTHEESILQENSVDNPIQLKHPNDENPKKESSPPKRKHNPLGLIVSLLILLLTFISLCTSKIHSVIEILIKYLKNLFDGDPEPDNSTGPRRATQVIPPS